MQGHEDTRRKRTVEEMWLYYFNDYLHTNGIITSEEWQRMRVKLAKDFRK